MQKNTLFYAVLFFTYTALSQTNQPELICSTGDHFSKASYQIDWSIGECITATHKTGSYTITQGFQQENSLTSIEISEENRSIKINVFPNPTIDFIGISIDQEMLNQVYNLILIDSNGRIIFSKSIKNSQIKINFSNYVSGVYYLTINHKDLRINSFKIIKQ